MALGDPKTISKYLKSDVSVFLLMVKSKPAVLQANVSPSLNENLDSPLQFGESEEQSREGKKLGLPMRGFFMPN